MLTAPPTAAPPQEFLFDKIREVFEENPHIDDRQLRFEAAEGSVRIHGNVRSYFQKQMAQEALLRLDEVEMVENHLEVTWV